jgi:hypothetical protein
MATNDCPISAYQAARPQPHETADQHVERDLLSVENDRLRRENAALRSALRAANRVIAPYAADDGARRR